MFFNIADEERNSDSLDDLFNYYLTFDHWCGLMNQNHYKAILNGDPDAANNTSESINKCLKTYASAGQKKSTQFSDQFATTKWITIKEKIPVNDMQNDDRKN